MMERECRTEEEKKGKEWIVIIIAIDNYGDGWIKEHTKGYLPELLGLALALEAALEGAEDPPALAGLAGVLEGVLALDPVAAFELAVEAAFLTLAALTGLAPLDTGAVLAGGLNSTISSSTEDCWAGAGVCWVKTGGWRMASSSALAATPRGLMT